MPFKSDALVWVSYSFTPNQCDQVVSISHTNQSQVVLLVKVKDQLVLPSLIQVEQVHY